MRRNVDAALRYADDPTDRDRYEARACAQLPPTVLLALAIVKAALDDYHGTSAYWRSDAARWLLWPDRDNPISFARLCDVLGWDVQAVRAALVRRRDTRRPARPRVSAW